MAYLSAAGDFAVSQVVDSVKGVHGRIRKADFADVFRTGWMSDSKACYWCGGCGLS